MKPFTFSRVGEKLTQRTGIQELMDDLGLALGGNPDMRMMGGGNPARIPAMEQVWRRRMQEILASGDDFERMLAHYDTPQGQIPFLKSLAAFFRREYGWDVGPENITVTNGSQNAFFFLFNLFGGEVPDGTFRRILLPLCPEYIGYADQGVHAELFRTCRPAIEEIGAHQFKYHVDFDRVEVRPDTAALCVSRPTNPTGNVLTNDEVSRLSRLAREHRVPLLIDNAYGAPFPGIIFSEVKPVWEPHLILSLSLSKLGLPGTRTGIIVADEDVVKAMCAINSVVSLANGNVGQSLVQPMLETGELLRLSEQVIRPFYAARSRQAQDWIAEEFDDSLPYRVHLSEGALFLWLWFPGLPITTRELYQRLKTRNVLVVPGCYFFYGLEDNWRHRDECIRVNYSQNESAVREGIAIIAEEVARAYAGE